MNKLMNRIISRRMERYRNDCHGNERDAVSICAVAVLDQSLALRAVESALLDLVERVNGDETDVLAGLHCIVGQSADMLADIQEVLTDIFFEEERNKR